MEDHKTIERLLVQMEEIEKNNYNTQNYITSMELLLTSENNGTVKDGKLSNQFNKLKVKINELDQLTKDFRISLMDEKQAT